MDYVPNNTHIRNCSISSLGIVGCLKTESGYVRFKKGSVRSRDPVPEASRGLVFSPYPRKFLFLLVQCPSLSGMASSSLEKDSSQRPGVSSYLSPLTDVYDRFSRWRTGRGLTNPGSVENLTKEVKSTCASS